MRFNFIAPVCLLMLPVFFQASECKAADEPVTLEIGSRAPDFTLPGVDGRDYSLKDFDQAAVLVLVFTANHCPTAQAYEDRIKALAAEYRDRGVALAAISCNDPLALRLDELGYTDMSDTFEEMQIRARDKGFDFPYLYDGETQKVSLAYGPASTPHVFIFDRERKLRYCGRIDNDEKIGRSTTHEARDAIEALLAGKPVAVETTKTFGCSVKWSDKKSSAEESLQRWAGEEVSVEPVDPWGVRALLANDSGKLRLVNVWATWCGPCVVEFPELVAINRMYRNRKFEQISISADSPAKAADVLAFLKKQQASFKNFQFSATDKYALIEAVDPQWPGSIPYTLLIEPGGKIIFRKLGEIDPLELKKAIVGYLGRYYE